MAENAILIHDKYRVITLPGLSVLKLIAFQEKSGQRQKDWEDFLLILRNYSTIAGAQLYEENYDDLIKEHFEYNLVAARMLGRHMQIILKKNEPLRNNILNILLGKLQNFTCEEIDQMYVVRDTGDELIETMKLIAEVIRGIGD